MAAAAPEVGGAPAILRGWGIIDRLLGSHATRLDPQGLRLARLTAAFSLALILWCPLFAGFYVLLGAYRLALFVAIGVLFVCLALLGLRRAKRIFASHSLLLAALWVLLSVGAYTGAFFSSTLIWLPVLPLVALLLLGRTAALLWAAIPLVAIAGFTAAALTGDQGVGFFTGTQLVAFHAAILSSAVVVQGSIAMLFESARVRMELELAAQRDLATRARDDARLLLDNVGQALFVVDANGAVGPSPSATALEWFGPHEGRAAFDWLSDDPQIRRQLAAHLAAFNKQPFEFERSGRSLALRLVPISNTQTALAITTDVTEAKQVARAESSRRQLSDQLVRAEERSRMKSDFLASTSHELRTPLNTIINIPQGILDSLAAPRNVRCSGCGQTFELDEGEAVPAACPSCAGALAIEPSEALAPEVTARLLRSVVTSGKHLLTVVNDILDYSRLEAGGQLLVRESTALSEVLEQLEGVMAPVAQRAGVGLVLHLHGDPHTQLRVDRVKLSQVLINLVSNAIKFSNGVGEVEVLVSTFEESTQGWISFEVRDRGIGIAAENLGLIFEGFRQVDHGSSRRYGGTGLGLAISKRLVELHGGRLEIESELGKGSTFRVRLPVSAPEPRAEEDAQGGHLVLLVDDEPAAAEVALATLRPLGWRVVALREPSKVLQRVRELKPAMVMLDVMMPRTSGFEVLKTLLADPVGASLRVVVTSAYPDNRAIAEALGVKFFDKPWVAEDLRAYIQTTRGGAP